MSYYIYGFRLAGDPECRYVGMTRRDPEDRLNYLTREGERRTSWGNPSDLHKWLLANRGNIETFKFAKVETKLDAHAHERAIVALILRMEHRLFNHWLVPADRRIGWEGNWKQKLARQYAQEAAA